MHRSPYERLRPATWDCQYPSVLVPKGRKQALSGTGRQCVGPVLHAWAAQRRRDMLAGHRVQEQVHRVSRSPPPYSVAAVVGCLKGTSAMAGARHWGGRQRPCNGATFWTRGDAVSTVGGAAEPMRRSIRTQEPRDAQGRAEAGDCEESLHPCIWQPLGLLTTVKPPALRERHDYHSRTADR